MLGLSLGGGIAVEFALLYPAATLALVAASGVLPGYAWSDIADAARELWLRHAMFAPILRLPEAGPRFERMVRDYSGWDWLHADGRVDLEPQAAGRLGELRTPTLAIVGEDDVPDSHRIAELVAREVGGEGRHAGEGGAHGEHGATRAIHRDDARIPG